jgi:thymidylate synthase
MTQTSCDIGFEAPLHVALFAALTRVLAHICDVPCGELILFMDRIHITDVMSANYMKVLSPFPRLEIASAVKSLDAVTGSTFAIS